MCIAFTEINTLRNDFFHGRLVATEDPQPHTVEQVSRHLTALVSRHVSCRTQAQSTGTMHMSSAGHVRALTRNAGSLSGLSAYELVRSPRNAKVVKPRRGCSTSCWEGRRGSSCELRSPRWARFRLKSAGSRRRPV